jgi:hypothetical protein
MLLSPLGLFHEFFSSPLLNLMAHYPMGTTSANHADLLYFLAPSVSAGQRPFIINTKGHTDLLILIEEVDVRNKSSSSGDSLPQHWHSAFGPRLSSRHRQDDK